MLVGAVPPKSFTWDSPTGLPAEEGCFREAHTLFVRLYMACSQLLLAVDYKKLSTVSFWIVDRNGVAKEMVFAVSFAHFRRVIEKLFAVRDFQS